MNYIIFDLEWNQGGEGEEQLTDVLPFEVIEIGAIKCNDRKDEVERFHRLIKPTVYHKLHYVTKKMLGISMEELEQEAFFPEVIQDFLDWCGEDMIFCTWGPLDLLELQRNIRYHGLMEQWKANPKIPFFKGPLEYLDVQKLFSLQYEDKHSRRNLEYAVDFLGIPKDMPFHRALDDAYYTAKVLARITNHDVEAHVSFDCFCLPINRKTELHRQFSDYHKYISREFTDKQEAMADKEVVSTKCYLCNKNLRKKIRWFSPNGKHFLSIAYCEKHGFVKSKIRMKKSENGCVYVVKTTRFVTEEDVLEIRQKQEKAKQQKLLHKKMEEEHLKNAGEIQKKPKKKKLKKKHNSTDPS